MKQLIIKTGLALFACAAAVVLPAQEAEIVQVIGKGYGTDKTEALKDAYRDAVERAVGLYVDAEQMVKNSQLVEDQILTQSNAYIEKYELATEEKKPNGLTEVRILADVRKKALTAKVNDVMPAATYSLGKGLSSVHAQMVTKEKRNADGAALLESVLADLDPLRSCIDLELASPECVTDDSQKGDLVNLKYLFKWSINEDRYFKTVMPRLRDVLRQISIVEVKETNATFLPNRKIDVAACFASTPSNRTGFDYDGTLSRELFAKRQGERRVQLVVGVNKKGTVYQLEEYQLDKEAYNKLGEWMRRIEYGVKSYGGPVFEVSFLDADGDVLLSQKADLRNYGVYSWICRGSHGLIGPWALSTIGHTVAIKEKCYWQSFQVPKDVLSEIRNLKIELAR